MLLRIVRAVLAAVGLAAGAFALGVPASAQVVIAGEISLSEPAEISAFSSIDIRLIDLAAPRAPVVTKTIARGDAPFPRAFTLMLRPEEVRSGVGYGLEARVSATSGVLETAEPVPVDPFSGAAVAVVLEPARARTLRAVRWQAVDIGGLPAVLGGNPIPARLVFSAGSGISAGVACLAVSGNARTLFGQLEFYDLRHDAPGACGPEAAKLEEALLDVLARTAGFRFADGTLLLLDEGGETLARYEGPPI